MKTSEVFTIAKKFIDTPEKWCKGELQNEEGAHCAIGAIRAAMIDLYGNRIFYQMAVDCYEEKSFWLLSEYLDDVLEGGPGITDFNDDPATTHADILVVFDKAIENALKEEKV